MPVASLRTVDSPPGAPPHGSARWSCTGLQFRSLRGLGEDLAKHGPPPPRRHLRRVPPQGDELQRVCRLLARRRIGRYELPRQTQARSRAAGELAHCLRFHQKSPSALRSFRISRPTFSANLSGDSKASSVLTRLGSERAISSKPPSTRRMKSSPTFSIRSSGPPDS